MEEGRTNITFLIALELDGVEEYDEENFAQTLPHIPNLVIFADPPAVQLWEAVNEYKGGDSITIYAQKVSGGPGAFKNRHPFQISNAELWMGTQVSLFVEPRRVKTCREGAWNLTTLLP